MAPDNFSAGQVLRVEVAYATPARQEIITLNVAPGTTAAQAIEASGIRDRFPEIGAHPPIGIFSRKVSAEHLVTSGDRIEIYRALRADPKEMRRQKARAERDAPGSGRN